MGRVLGLTFIAQLIIQLQGLIVMPIILRWAGPATYGAYTMLFVTTVVFFELATSAIAYPYVRNLVSAASSAERRRLFEPQITFCMSILGLVSGALLCARPVTIEVAAGTSISTVLLIGVLAANLLQRQGLDYFRYTLRFVPYSVILGGPPLIFMALLTATVALQHAPTLDTLVLLQCAAGIGISLPFLLKMLREIGLPHPRLPVAILIRNIRAGLPVTLDGIVAFALGFSDRYLISLFLSVTAVGIYHASYQAAAIAFFIGRLLHDALSPVLSRLVDLGKRTDAETLVADFFRLFLMIAIPFIAGMLMVGPSFLGLLTTREIAYGGRWVMPLIALAITINAFLAFMRAVAIALGRLPTILAARTAGAVANVGANFLLLPLIANITVAAVNTVVGFAASSIWLGLAFRSQWRLPLDLRASARFSIAALTMGAGLWLMGYRPGVVEPENVLHLGTAITLSILIYFGALSALGGFGRREISQISALLSGGAVTAAAR